MLQRRNRAFGKAVLSQMRRIDTRLRHYRHCDFQPQSGAVTSECARAIESIAAVKTVKAQENGKTQKSANASIQQKFPSRLVVAQINSEC